ncbi:T-complex protein 1 [Lentinula edodes]|uniref:T-complex protein 1 n=1 Tax=Lentinula edodes TaxID=5353 RepID=A0A1Q3EHJ7_LENED|nr:T-complex protein 1 [Lentinula edodes]
MVEAVCQVGCDLVLTEKGVSDLAQHHFLKHNVSCIRRVRKSDSNRIALAVGATIVNRVEDLRESDVGTGCEEMRVDKIGDEYFTVLAPCKSPHACTILLRSPSKDIPNEVDWNLQDAMSVSRNVIMDPRLVPGGGAIEMVIGVGLAQAAKRGSMTPTKYGKEGMKESTITGVETGPFLAVAEAMEVIPRTLVQNAGGNAIRVLTKLRVSS